MSEIHPVGDVEYRIALVTCEWHNPEVRKEDVANAALIASAPQLLDVAVRLLAAFNDLRAGLRPSEIGVNIYALVADAEEAIAKAKGGQP